MGLWKSLVDVFGGAEKPNTSNRKHRPRSRQKHHGHRIGYIVIDESDGGSQQLHDDPIYSRESAMEFARRKANRSNRIRVYEVNLNNYCVDDDHGLNRFRRYWDIPRSSGSRQNNQRRRRR